MSKARQALDAVNAGESLMTVVVTFGGKPCKMARWRSIYPSCEYGFDDNSYMYVANPNAEVYPTYYGINDSQNNPGYWRIESGRSGAPCLDAL